MTFRELLETHHGKIDDISISIEKPSDKDMPKMSHDEWFEWNRSRNIDFVNIGMNLMHSNKKLEDFEDLKKYLDMKVTQWGYYVDYGTGPDDKIFVSLDINLYDMSEASTPPKGGRRD